MAYTQEQKNHIIDTLYTKADGKAYKCAKLTGVDKKTILIWKNEFEQKNQGKENPEELPDTELIKEKIIRRVNQLVETCTDPKKLMDTYEAIVKFEKESGHNKESIFDKIKRELEEN